jgi:ATP-dependent DNA ligase
MYRVLARLRFIEPQLPTLVEAPPEGPRWIHEIKHDGYRSQVLIENGCARVFTRNGFDWRPLSCNRQGRCKATLRECHP